MDLPFSVRRGVRPGVVTILETTLPKILSSESLVFGLLLLVGGGFVFRLAIASSPEEIEIAGYATSLKGRTESQRHNARLAAQALNGKTIMPGQEFSFNSTVKSWSQDRGFVKAPVSYDGELIRAFGGGVCQTSTTLYNAALLAGLPVTERHPHVFAPHYVPPGQDAAVAQPNIDLRFRNPYTWPVQIKTIVDGEHLDIRIYGAKRPDQHITVTTEVLATMEPERLTRVVRGHSGMTGRSYVRNPGSIGYRVVSYRQFRSSGREARREKLGDDTYQAMDRIVQVVD